MTIVIVFVFKGFQCHRVASWTFRRCRRWRRARVCRCCCSIEDEDSDEETSESDRRGDGGDEERGNSSIARVLDGDGAEMSRALGEGVARDDGDGRGGRFEPDLWRYLAVERDLER